MPDQARFTITFTLHDNRGELMPISVAVGVDEELRISCRAVEAMKAPSVFEFRSIEDAVALMEVKTFRRDLFIRAAQRLAGLVADRMEDAEGWHDESRVGPARDILGGKWKW